MARDLPKPPTTARPIGNFSRRHKTSAPQREARELYLKTHPHKRLHKN